MSENTIVADARYVRANDVVAADMDGEIVMMDVEKGAYFALSGGGTEIWDKFAEPMRIDELVSSLKDEFDTDEFEDFEGLVTDFVAGLLDKGLVKIAS